MKSLKIILLAITVGGFLIVFQQSCQSGKSNADHTAETPHHEYHSLLEEIHAKSLDSISYDMENPYLAEGNPSVNVATDLKGKTAFQVEAVQNKLKYFPCSNCHTESLEKLQSGLNQKTKQSAHWEVSLKHANTEIMNCQTCHSPTDPDSLQSLSGKAISFEHSYKVCGQCHSSQINDWVGGAHGKRLGGWVEPRVAKTCVSCHNPHKPAFDSRWPARLNTFKIKTQDYK